MPSCSGSIAGRRGCEVGERRNHVLTSAAMKGGGREGSAVSFYLYQTAPSVFFLGCFTIRFIRIYFLNVFIFYFLMLGSQVKFHLIILSYKLYL